MTKVKYLVFILIASMLVSMFPNFVSATDDADTSNADTSNADTTAEAIVEYTRTIPSNDGTIKLNFTGLNLDEAKAYEFALVRQGGTPENWFSIDDGYTETTATITLSSATPKIVDVLKATDTGFIYIREKDDTTGAYVLEAYKVDLKLPYLQSLIYTKGVKSYDLTTARLYGSIGNNYIYTGGNYTYVYWEKVTDEELIVDYLHIKNNGGEITALEASLPTPSSSGYVASRDPYYTDKNDGLYLLWVWRTGENCKNVYSCIVHDGLEEATKVEQYIAGLDVEKPTVQSIAVTSPESGTYKTGQTVKITVTFSEEITGENVPTLKIKFGTSEERTVTNGTISGKTIVYSYNIVDGDKGQLAVTGYTGGTIKDAAGNDATIETKVVSGNTIKANVEGTTTNNTENQDKQNNGTNEGTGESTNGATNNGATQETNKGTTTENKTESKNDQTTATGKMPHAGVEIGIMLAILAVIVVGAVVYSKYNGMRDI